MMIRCNPSSSSFLCTAIYGNPQRSSRERLWEELEEMVIEIEEPWVLVGDFSAILSHDER